MKENKIGENQSSGAEKVENIIREKHAKNVQNESFDGGRDALNKENAHAASRIEHAVRLSEQRKARAIAAEQKRARHREQKAAEKSIRERKLQEQARENSKLALNLLSTIRDIDMNRISPMHAFDILNDLVNKAKEGDDEN